MEEAQADLLPLLNNLRLNTTPTPIESIQIKTLISQGECDLTQLDAEITRAQAVLDKLENRRRELHRRVDTYRAVLAPVRRLPQEILGEIFLLCMEDLVNRRPAASFAPLLFCQICSVWRNVAIGHRALWKSIALYFVPRNTGTQLEIMKVWLDRAKALPLDLVIAAVEDCPYFDMTALIPYLPTTRKIIICLPSDNLRSILATDVPDSTPLLEEASIVLPSNPDAPDHGPFVMNPLSLFRHTPRLRSLSITCSRPYPILPIHNLQISFSHIRILNLENISFPDNVAAMLFKELVDLEELYLRMFYPDLWDVGRLSDSLFPIVIPKLRHLEVTVNRPDKMYRLLRMVTLPLIDNLGLSYEASYPLDLTEFYRLQTRSSFTLWRLALSRTEFEPGDFTTLLRANPSLTSLEIEYVYSRDSETLRVLNYSPDTNPILPKLQDLRIVDDYGDETDGDLLVELIKSRWWSDSNINSAFESSSRTRTMSRLRYVYLRIEEGGIAQHTAVAELLGSAREGLHLDFSDNP